MPSPFPAMDPYLERPGLWPNVHHGLISEIQATMNRQLSTRYVANIETRVYISDDDDPGPEVMVPDVLVDFLPKKKNGTGKASTSTLPVTESPIISFLEEEIEEANIEIKQPKSETLVTVIEVLSPTNKVSGSAGRRNFLSKRRDVMASEVHWVEIDLFRAGKPTAIDATLRPTDYRIIVSRGNDHLHAQSWPLSIRQALPIIPIPLRGKDPDQTLDLGAILQSAYERGSYDRVIDYTKPPTPLSSDDAKWADKLLKEKGLR